MLNYIENIGLFRVAVGKRTKLINGALTNYLKIGHHVSFASYIKKNKSLLKKHGLDYATLCTDQNYFEENKKKFVNLKYDIAFENIFDECWIIETYHKNTNIRVFKMPPIFDEKTAIKMINEILLDYGITNNIPKFTLVKFVPEKIKLMNFFTKMY